MYTCFIDFEGAFDSIHQEILKNIMKHYGNPEKKKKRIQAVKCIYKDNECAVIT